MFEPPRWESVEIRGEELAQPLDLAACFQRSAPVEVDVGCGDGSFLLHRAECYPERNFLGIEKLPGRISKLGQRSFRERRFNIRTIRMDAAGLVMDYLPAGSVDLFHILFPDPWPKSRHHRRRLIQPEFIAGLVRALKSGGELRLATDHAGYHAWMEEVLKPFSVGLIPKPWPRDEPGISPTDFERLFLAESRPIYRLRRVRTR